jgi:hypothetical protein
VDVLRRGDVEQMRNTPATETARQAFELMRIGIRLERAALRARNPDASAEHIEDLVQTWLDGNDD